jgi:hypothetical protein
MYYKAFITASVLLFLVTISLLVGPGCANIVPPQGGPRDSLPPVLMKATPGDSTRNFNGNKITFTFDEFVDLQAVQQNLMVSPSPRINPTVDFRLNTVTVKLRDSLESNTTYSLNFGEAIKDYTEGNALKNFTYTFSTGPYIDSLELTGRVILAETGKTDTTLMVLLHTSSDDSAVIKERPRYVTKLDSRGNFIFRNLPPKEFYLYALQDEGGTRRYLSKKQLFAFADKPVTPALKTEPVTLYAYAVKDENKPASSTTTNDPANRTGGRNRNTGADNRLKYQTFLTNNQQDLLGRFSMSFEQPLRVFDSTRIRLYTDSAYNVAGAYSFQQDSTRKKLELVHQWKENTLYHIILDKDFAEDTLGRKLLKTDTLHFTTKKLADYGALQLKFRNLDLKKNPVLLFVSNDAVIRMVPLAGDSYSETSFVPGEYELRILYDDNKNGRWDPGEFFGKHKQPELVKPVERRITVKPAWQNEFEIAL